MLTRPDLTNVIVPYAGLTLLVCLGAVATWRRLLDRERITTLAEMTVGLLLPVFAFWHAATGSAASVLGQAPWIVVLALVGGLAGYLIATALARMQGWEWPQRSVLQVVGVSGNTAFLGIPVCAALYGSEGVMLALLYDFGASIFLFTVGLAAFQQPAQIAGRTGSLLRTGVRHLVNPLLVSLLLGLGVALAGWSIPPILRQPLESLSNTVIPLMMLMLGGMIYNFASQPDWGRRDVFLLTFLKLICLPVLTLLAVNLLRLPVATRGVVVVEAAMPSAVITAVFAERYNADRRLAASAVMVTTLLSALTVPVFTIVVR